MTIDPLKSRLREEAAATTPEFSPLLHQRIMSHIRRSEIVPAPHRGNYRRPMVAAAAVIALTATTFIVLRQPPLRSRAPVALPSPKDIAEPVDQLLSSAAAPAAASLDESKFAY